MASSPIKEFYSGRSVFMTGSTGFCGKILLEKLLRCCPDIGHVYVLMRPKKGQESSSRLDQMFRDPVFEVLLKQQPTAQQKVTVVAGDISQPELGVSQGNRQLLCQNVSVVFHAAATIRFNENLKVALQTNVLSTESMVQLCKDMPGLKAFVYVSTAYSQCPRQEIEEKVYPPPEDPQSLLRSTEWMTEEDFSAIEPKLLGEWPNTYSYSKALAEDVIKKQGVGLPVAIFRPSIVISTWKEPMPGWIDNVNGPTMGMVGSVMGVIRCGYVDGRKISDLVPVDMVCNGLIATAWETANKSCTDEVKVYNFVSGAERPITWGEYFGTCAEFARLWPPLSAVWYCVILLCPYKWLYLFVSFWLELIPACIIDALPYLRTGKHKKIDLYNKSGKFLYLVAFFATKQWKYHNENVRHLRASLSDEDRRVFYCDVRDISWREYLLHYMRGLRLYVLKESPDTLPEARRRYRKLYVYHWMLRIIVVYTIYKLVRGVVSLADLVV